MSFPPATEMFQFAGFASPTYGFSRRYPCGWVAPFGDPGINDRSHLPRAYRSVPRPSSPLSAKASTRCPYYARSRISRQRYPTNPPLTGTKTNPANDASREDTLPQRQVNSSQPSARSCQLRTETPASVTLSSPCQRTLPKATRLRQTELPRSSRHATGPPPLHTTSLRRMVEVNGIEPMTSCLQSRRSPN
jgi:hypothetical protein